MKVCLLLLVAFGAALALPKGPAVDPIREIPIKIKPRDILTDLIEFIALIPLDDVISVGGEFIEKDPAVAFVLRYLQSDDWNDLVEEVLNKELAKEFIEDLKKGGLPVDLILIALRAAIESADPGAEPDEEASLRPFLDAIEEVIPFDDLAALLEKKLQNSPDAQDLYTIISSEDGKTLVDEVLQMDEAVRIQERLKAMGAEVDELLGTLYEFFGWGKPPQ